MVNLKSKYLFINAIKWPLCLAIVDKTKAIYSSLHLYTSLIFKSPNKRISYSFLCFSLCFTPFAFSTELEQAQRMHQRLTGVPANSATLTQMETELLQGDSTAAANIAMEHPDFYRTTLKLFAAPWTNIDQDVFAPLNDYSATVIGLIRDDIDFRQVLQADTVYIGEANLGLPPYSNNNNQHYVTLDEQGVDLKKHLISTAQSSLNGLPSAATAGVLTTRAAAKEFFYLGTNRAMFRFTLINHLCSDLEPLKDNTRSPDRIRQDVSRSPGGDSRLFLNNCLACHSGMDPMAQAFAYYEYDFDRDNDPEGENGNISYNQTGAIDASTQSRVQAKYHINSGNFPFGYVTPNDAWQNYWRAGINSKLGWDSQLSGQGHGAKSLGQELANSEAFAQCQVKKVFKTVCLREPNNAADINQLNMMTSNFKANGYKMKPIFAASATHCMGE